MRAIKDCAAGLIVEGKIMGSMPMKAVLRPEELRAAFKLLSVKLLLKTLKMLVTRRSEPHVG